MVNDGHSECIDPGLDFDVAWVKSCCQKNTLPFPIASVVIAIFINFP